MSVINLSSAFSCDFEILSLAIINNIDYFYFIRDKTWYASQFVSLLGEMLRHLHWYEEQLKVINSEVERFDFNKDSRGNGFRSFKLIIERCFMECYQFCKKLNVARSSLFFRPGKFLKQTENLVSMLQTLKPGFNYLIKMLAESDNNQLVMLNKSITAEELISECAGINQLGFYGNFLGFYYCSSMRRILQGVSIIMATFSDLYQNSGSPISRAIAAVLNGVKYIINSELRAQQIVDVAQNASVEFVKAFWSLSEIHFMKQLPSWICPNLEVRKEILIPPEAIKLFHLESFEPVNIPAPSSHIPSAPIRCILLSAVNRKRELACNEKKSLYLSKNLLFHCHGGGFVSQTPESHEIYLRNWAYELNIPILSVDYSLSPEAPFPRALEEVLLAYAWCLNNAEKLGWTGERIYFAGDSAGGNLLMGTILKIISLGVRQPDGILCAYAPLVLDMVPSPSRLLCWLDPLLPLGFMISCLDAYVGSMETDGNEYDDEPPECLGRKSRKISSISEIFDSSLMFLNELKWIEIETNESRADESVFTPHCGLFNPQEKDYVSFFMDDYIDYFSAYSTNETYEDRKEYLLFDFPRDVAFGIKTKGHLATTVSLNMLLKLFVSTSVYRRFLSPLLPQFAIDDASIKRQLHPSKKLSILQKMKNLKIISKNPFMSPLLATDNSLKHMPPVYFVSSNFDPCLDDCVMFAKRLSAINQRVTIDIVDGLPHGFLNFLPFSQEAHNASDICIHRLKEAMKI